MRGDVRKMESTDIIVELDEMDMREKTILPLYAYVAQCMGYMDSEV